MGGKLGIGIALGAAATIVILAGIGLTIVYTGAYNVAATDAHADLVRWALATTNRNSVADRAEGLLDQGLTLGYRGFYTCDT